MSRPAPRPGVRRTAGGPPSKASSPAQTRGLNVDELRNLPEFVDDGETVDLDPANASDGGFAAGEGTKCTISAARFGKFEYINKEGVVVGDSGPQLRLFVEFTRDGYEFPRKESMNYANWERFAPTKDGNKVMLRAKTEDGRRAPAPYKFNAGVLFLQSLVNADTTGKKVTKEILNTEGIKSIVGLTVVVRKQKVSGQNENAKPALLVDYIEGINPSQAAPVASPAGPAAASKPTRPAAPAPAAQAQAIDSAIVAMAVMSLVTILKEATDNTIERAQIPAAIIRMQTPVWSTNDQRSQILKTLRDDTFIAGQAEWAVDGTAIVLA